MSLGPADHHEVAKKALGSNEKKSNKYGKDDDLLPACRERPKRQVLQQPNKKTASRPPRPEAGAAEHACNSMEAPTSGLIPESHEIRQAAIAASPEPRP